MWSPGDLLFTGWTCISIPCVLWGTWRLLQRIWHQDNRARLRLAAIALLPVLLGTVVGYCLPGGGLGGGILAISVAGIIMICCFLGVVLSIPEYSRRILGSAFFELAALIVLGVVLGATVSSFLRYS